VSAFKNWHVVSNAFTPIGEVSSKLPAGHYQAVFPYSEPWRLEPTTFNADAVVDLPGLPTALLHSQLNFFWEREDRYTRCGLVHKRGVLLYGPAGCGKTTIIKAVSDAHIARGGIVFHIGVPRDASTVLAALRQVEPTRPVMTIIEDIERLKRDSDTYSGLLSLLDGQSQINHVVHFATTNWPDDLDETLTKRPGRFDLVINMRPPVREARREYLRHLLNGAMQEDELEKLVVESAGLSFAHLRELVAATYCLDAGREETLARLVGSNNRKHFGSGSSEEGLGFSVKFREER
jgi:energy-coupling factor transporter ATP-binding protein EcfA2